MYKRQKKKRKTKRVKQRSVVNKQPYGYQPNNPLTLYYKKYIEA